METYLKFAELLALTAWLGSILFFSFLVAPTLFRTLDAKEAGRAVRALFPRYYLVGIIAALVMVAVTATRGALWTWAGTVIPTLGLMTFLLLLTLYARQSLSPRINALRDAGPIRKDAFKALHRQSVLINGLVLVVLLFYAFWMAMRGY